MTPLLLLLCLPADDVKAALGPFVERGALAGAVALVSDKDRTLSVDAVGYADIAAKKPMTADALFWIASQTKPITAAALMMLVDEGKVKLDDPVAKYLPEFAGVKLATGEKPKAAMTVRHLLSHTSGMPFGSAKEKPTLDGLTLADAVASYVATPLHSEPGAKYVYANSGINTAGRIIEVVSGMPYETFLQKRLFGPLGMKDTTFRPTKEQLSRLAKGYRPGKDGALEETKVAQLTYPLDDARRQPMPGGGLFSTAEDVATFCRMVLNGGTRGMTRFLSESSVKEMTTKQTGALKESYGLGWQAGPTYGHGGAWATSMTVDPKRGRVTVWLVQHTGDTKAVAKAREAFGKAAGR